MPNRRRPGRSGGWRLAVLGLLLAAIPPAGAQAEAGFPCGAGARCSAAQWCNATTGECRDCYGCAIGQECLARLGCRNCTAGTIDHGPDDALRGLP